MKYLKSYYALITGISILLSFFRVTAQPYQLKNCKNYGLRTPDRRYEDAYFISRDTGFICDLLGNIYKTTDTCNNWTLKIGAPTAGFRSIEFSDDGQTGIAGTLNGKLYRSDDRGENWIDISNSLPDIGTDAKRMCGLAHSGNNNFFGVGWWGGEQARFYRSTDAGRSWAVKYIDKNIVNSLVDIVCKDANTIFATGGKQFNGRRQNVVLKSTDNGDTWTEAYADTTLGGNIWKIQFVTSQIGYGAIESYYYPDTVAIIKTTDGGSNWNIIHIGSVNRMHSNISTQAVGFIDEHRGWVGGYFIGYYETFDGGQTWKYVNDMSIIGMNRIFRLDAETIYATHRGGIARNGLLWPAGIADKYRQPLVPTNKLNPIVPNPAKNKIQIAFEIGRSSNVVMEVINISNQKTKRIMSARMPPGKYTQTIDISAYPKGNYMIWLGNDEIPLIQKFVIQ